MCVQGGGGGGTAEDGRGLWMMMIEDGWGLWGTGGRPGMVRVICHDAIVQ